jgi:CheY-like chemotaxis protein
MHALFKEVLFTASADKDVFNKGKESGVDEVLSKPFSIEQV